MNILAGLLERVGNWLGLEVDDVPSVDNMAALAPYEAPDRADAAFASLRRFERARGDCEHHGLRGVDNGRIDSTKVWECDACGWLCRIVVNPEKPWFVRELVQVDDLTASHAVSGAATLRPPAPAVVASDALHIDLMDAS